MTGICIREQNPATPNEIISLKPFFHTDTPTKHSLHEARLCSRGAFWSQTSLIPLSNLWEVAGDRPDSFTLNRPWQVFNFNNGPCQIGIARRPQSPPSCSSWTQIPVIYIHAEFIYQNSPFDPGTKLDFVDYRSSKEDSWRTSRTVLVRLRLQGPALPHTIKQARSRSGCPNLFDGVTRFRGKRLTILTITQGALGNVTRLTVVQVSTLFEQRPGRSNRR
ncbi:hypothetical protein B0H13DRAFT_1892047 [Mycena leptocephala]|nr:hypothetical protein B0H13DRAFT_1892047 [Mycena leptocephala]